ncbi:MAG: glycosyltransferase involved in cell wall biosynthesis [Candidatus Paceibacteria bacterium]|jgi:glycosyltransferase involved in cell wall biosynthesis
MKILITTGIFEPDSGGPATYAPRIAKKLQDLGHEVKVITLSSSKEGKHYPFPVLRVERDGKFKTLLKLHEVFKQEVPNYDLVYSLDWFTLGLPLALACKKKNIPYILRVGGGYIWEKYLRDGKPPMSLTEFYEKKLYKMYKYRVMYTIIRYVLQNAKHIIFNTDIQPEFYIPAFNLDKDKISTVFNPVPNDIEATRTRVDDEIVFAGRMIAMKNLNNLIRGYKESGIETKLTLIGNGPQRKEIEELVKELELNDKVSFEDKLDRDKLYERIKNVKLVVIPSWTDISPNQAYECLSLNIPFLITKETYLPIKNQIPLMLDPASPEDISKKLKMVLGEGYNKYTSDLSNIKLENSWSTVADTHEEIFKL